MQPLPPGPQMDPSILISGVSALLKAIDVWVRYRDSSRAAEAFEEEQREALLARTTVQEGAALASVVPQEILDSMTERAAKCWTRYHAMSKGNYLPEELDDATEAVKACICRELKRLDSLGEPLTGVLGNWWSLYCSPNSLRRSKFGQK